MRYFHSVTLDREKCKGCTNCIKYCPTEAIRVRDGKAVIIDERCIDCGECIRRCPHQAKRASLDNLDLLKSFKIKAVIPAPSLYGQFKPEISIDKILNSLLSLGFDYVFEVASAAELVSDLIKTQLEQDKFKKPAISSACPAVIRLIQVRFPELLEHVIPVESPMEVAAGLVKEKLQSTTGLGCDEIGVFFVSPCAAKVTSVKSPLGRKNSNVDGVLSISSIYSKLMTGLLKEEKVVALQKAGGRGISWAISGGESLALKVENYLAVDGSENVIKVFEELEMGKLSDIDFIEGQACLGGCVGGPLTIENSFIAKKRIRSLTEKYKNFSENILSSVEHICEIARWTEKLQPREILKLDSDRNKALEKMIDLEEISKDLPGLDCGSCGAPNCRALAEDIVRGVGSEFDCVFKLRERIRVLAENMVDLSNKVPPSISKEKK
ncbi:MAG: [Fe-Fe] hydrogenase large subunit C-terminal domain-containing protein [Peptococcales bacterium]|jgi:iron only hydrogenase large subunit-like protein